MKTNALTQELLGGGPGRQQNKLEILRRRAAAFACAAPKTDEEREVIEIVEFNLDNERYAVESVHVREVYPLRNLTPVPCTPAFIIGIINIRGRILSIINLKTFFDLSNQALGNLNKVIILHSNEMEMGVLADQVTGTARIRVDQLQPALPTMTGARKDYLKGIGPGELVVLDAAKILADQKLIIKETA